MSQSQRNLQLGTAVACEMCADTAEKVVLINGRAVCVDCIVFSSEVWGHDPMMSIPPPPTDPVCSFCNEHSCARLMSGEGGVYLCSACARGAAELLGVDPREAGAGSQQQDSLSDVAEAATSVRDVLAEED
jgi:hypothetical protein